MVRDLQQEYEELNEAARALFQQRKYKEAIKQWEEVLALCAGRPIQENTALSWIAECYQRLGKPKDAADALQQLVVLKQRRGLLVQPELVERIATLRRAIRRS